MPKFETVEESVAKVKAAKLAPKSNPYLDKGFSPIVREYRQNVIGERCVGCGEIMALFSLIVVTEDGRIQHYGHRRLVGY